MEVLVVCVPVLLDDDIGRVTKEDVPHVPSTGISYDNSVSFYETSSSRNPIRREKLRLHDYVDSDNEDFDRWSPITSKTINRQQQQTRRYQGHNPHTGAFHRSRDAATRAFGNKGNNNNSKNDKTPFFNLDRARAKIYSNQNSGVRSNKGGIPLPSFSSNSQLRNFIYYRKGKAIDSASLPAGGIKVQCPLPKPVKGGFQGCVATPCQYKDNRPEVPSSPIETWLTGLIEETKQLV